MDRVSVDDEEDSGKNECQGDKDIECKMTIARKDHKVTLIVPEMPMYAEYHIRDFVKDPWSSLP